MSNLLEDAIVDAKALKEAAFNNVKETLVEEYAPQIKSAIDALLEQEDDDEDLDLGMSDGELGLDMGLEPELPSATDNIPLAATDGEDLCSCAEDEEEIEIDFSDLESAISKEEEEEGLSSSELIDRDEVAMEFEDEKDELDLDEKTLRSILEETFDDLEDLDEELEIDLKPVLNGYLGSNEAERERAIDIALANEPDNEELKKLKKSMEALRESVSKSDNRINEIEKKNEGLIKENLKYKNVTQKLTEEMEKLNISNAKLLYINRILDDGSLNGQQKQRFANSINEAKTVEDVTAIYKVIKSTVDNSLNKNVSKSPSNINEAVKARPSLYASPRKEKKQSVHEYDRMQRLAGIKK